MNESERLHGKCVRVTVHVRCEAGVRLAVKYEGHEVWSEVQYKCVKCDDQVLVVKDTHM